jgi:hypothetical protein
VAAATRCWTMVLAPRFRMGPPSRSFAADAHDCIVVAILTGRPNTSSWRAICAHDGELPLGIVSVADTALEKTRPIAQVCRCARGRQGQVAPRWPSATLTAAARSSLAKNRSGRGDVAARPNKEITHNEKLTPIAPYKSYDPFQTLRTAKDDNMAVLGTPGRGRPACDRRVE